MKEKIIVSNSGKQYTHQLVFALQKFGYNVQFYTSFWYKPAKFPFTLISLLPKSLRTKVKRQFMKRFDERIHPNVVSQFPFFELIREFLDKILKPAQAEYTLYFRDRIHDFWVSKNIDNNTKIVIGYEECSLRTFRKAKQLGITTVLDLAQIHYKEIEIISNRFPVFGGIYANKKLRKKINRVKQEELDLSDYILCLSDFAKQSLLKHGIPQEKIFVVNLGFDPSKFKAKKNYASSGKLKLVFAGTMTMRKGLDTLFNALVEVAELADLTLIGPMADAQQLFAQTSLKFTWHKYLDHKEMNVVFNNSDLFIFPSYLDSWAMVVIEAMACGLPVVISDNTGAKDAVSNNSGFVITTGDSVNIIEIIKSLNRNRDQIEEMGNKAVVISKNYTWDNYSQSLNNIVKRVLNRQ